MIEVLRTNDPVLLSFAEALLRDARIEAVVLDTHMSVVEGSLGILPRRIVVRRDDAARALDLLAAAGIGGAAEGPS